MFAMGRCSTASSRFLTSNTKNACILENEIELKSKLVERETIVPSDNNFYHHVYCFLVCKIFLVKIYYVPKKCLIKIITIYNVQ
jgi:hypothetical protein